MDHLETTNPSMGSNELGRESAEENLTASLLSGTNTQLHIAALGAKKKAAEPVTPTEKEKSEFSTMEDSDE